MTTHTLAPRMGLTGERLAHFATLMEETFEDCAVSLATSKAAIGGAVIGVAGAILAEIDRASAADLFNAIAAAIRNAGQGGAELDRRRVDAAMSALFAADAVRKRA